MDKKRTTQATRVPSNVPNDYDRLPAPGALNIPLNGPRRRQMARRNRRGRLPGWAKAIIAIGGAILAFGIVALIVAAIVFRPFFRNLEPRYQQRIIDLFPPAEYFKPTVPFEVLPTISGADNSDAAQQLLLSPEPLGTDEPTEESTPVGATPTLDEGDSGVEDDGGIPVGMAGTGLPPAEPTTLPVYEAPTALPAPAGPTWTPVPQAVAAVPAEAEPISLPPSVRLENIRYEAQNWNNCGPTTMTMALSYYGYPDNQLTAARWMKPYSEDKNVSPWQMVRFVNEQTGLRALYRMGGNEQLLKRLLAMNFPVIIEKGFQPAGEDWMGHYLLLIGYDESAQTFLTYDSYLGHGNMQGRRESYADVDRDWRHFNRLFIVVYETSREAELRLALGDYVDPEYGARVALEVARTEATKNVEDKFAWFNMGTSYVALKDYENAAIAYDRAFQLRLPWRMLWYQFGPYEAYYNVGRYNDVLSLAKSNLGTTTFVEETYYWQGMAHAANGNRTEALSNFDRALTVNKNFFPAQEAKAQVQAGTFVANTTSS